MYSVYHFTDSSDCRDVITAKVGIQTIFGHCIDSGFRRNDKGGNHSELVSLYRAIATRYDKRAPHFLGAVYLAASVIWLN
jgi:hypothetical protein